jgi:hypothetical protein
VSVFLFWRLAAVVERPVVRLVGGLDVVRAQVRQEVLELVRRAVGQEAQQPWQQLHGTQSQSQQCPLQCAAETHLHSTAS